MTDNELLARWQGWKVKVIKPDIIQYPVMFPDQWVMYNDDGEQQPLPDYPNDEAACGSLLDTLVEKGYDPALIYYRGTSAWHMQIFDGEVNAMYPQKPTCRMAIVAACLEVARKEAQGE